jgi:adenosylcobinamide-GDP ribazoletransferase
MSLLYDFLTALQFLTRIPVPQFPFTSESFPRSVKFYPVIGAIVGSLAALVHHLLTPHLSPVVTATLTVAFTVLLTGALHEDGLADVADAFGGGWTRDRVLLILRDSRIGAYGAAALALSLILRITLLSSLSPAVAIRSLVAAHILCRWTTLPLSFFFPAARPAEDGQGVRIASLTTTATLVFGTVFTFAAAALLLHARALPALALACTATLLSGLYYRHRIGGVTGDCFGATNQLAEITTYLTAAWS